jgi:sugar phosphate isomerase/epimerase
MKLSQIAAQLYTVRDFTQTPEDLASTLKKVRAIGYQSVQVSAIGPIDNAELVKILQGEGLTCCATHEDANLILNDPAAVAAKLVAIDCKYTAYPYPRGIDFGSEAEILALAAKLDASGAVLRKSGRALAYHNHAIEFVRFGSRTALEIIYGATSPENLTGEPDTYWIQYGGGDPADWCTRLAGRLPILHLKDYAFSKENKIEMAEIGQGNLNWTAIIAAAEKSGCEWFVVEQDTCPGDPFVSLKKSFDYLAANFVS